MRKKKPGRPPGDKKEKMTVSFTPEDYKKVSLYVLKTQKEQVEKGEKYLERNIILGNLITTAIDKNTKKPK